MKISNQGLELIKQFEGCRLTAYQDVGGVWTIGYGHTGNVHKGDIIFQWQADELLHIDIAQFEKKVNDYNMIYHWNQNEFDAMVSFAFNIGNIHQITDTGKRTRSTIAAKMLEYVNVDGKPVQGLMKRRQKERELFLGVYDPITNPVAPTGIAAIQTQINKMYDFEWIATDGIFGTKTRAAMVKVLQTELNHQFKKGLSVDGIFGVNTYNACVNVKKGADGNLTWLIQARLICAGHDLKDDGIYGEDTRANVCRFQIYSRLNPVDGIVGKNTWRRMFV